MSLAPVSMMEIAHHKGDSSDNFRKGDQDYDYGLGSKWAGLVSEARELAARFNKDISGGQDMLGGPDNMNLAANGHLGSDHLTNGDQDDDDEDGDDEDEEDEDNEHGHQSSSNLLNNVSTSAMNANRALNSSGNFVNSFPFAHRASNSDSSDDDEGIRGGHRISNDTNPFDMDLNQWSSDDSTDSDNDSLPKVINEPLECRFCGKSYDKVSRLQHHEGAHEGKHVYQCRTCDQIFASRDIREKVSCFYQ